MLDHPFAFPVALPGGIPAHFNGHLVRRLSNMEGQYADEASCRQLIAAADPVVYEVYEIRRPQTAGELLLGTSIIHPGKVGAEYFMTKGHFHAVLETAEVYYGLQGEGVMVMETPEGDWAIEALRPGCVLYVPPRWAHRSVNTGTGTDLVTLFVYPAHAGHDYGTVARQGFRKLVLERDGHPAILDNPRWRQEPGA
jgi:glucose-6-phosphate isomerase